MANYGIDEPIPEYFKTSLPTPASNVAPPSFGSNLGGLLFGGAAAGAQFGPWGAAAGGLLGAFA